MSEHDSTTKEEESSNAAHSEPGEGHSSSEGSGADPLSIEKVDAIIHQQDPEFAKNLKQIEKISSETAPEFNSEKFKFEMSFADELELWKRKTWFKRQVARFLPFIPKYYYKKKEFKAFVSFSKVKLKNNTIYFFKHFKPITLGAIQRTKIKIKDFIKRIVDEVKSYSKYKKIGLGVFILVAGFSVNIVYKLLTHKLIKVQKELFLLSLDEWAQEKYFYDANDPVEAFYDSTRMVQNILNLKKIWVNLKPSASSGPNPMAALEFFVEGTISDAVVEIKDRESEVGDLFLRTIEDMSYDEITSAEGKQALCDRLGKEVNNILTRGKVRHVYIKTAIIKP